MNKDTPDTPKSDRHEYFAHKDAGMGRTQSVWQHLNGTAAHVETFAGAFGAAEEGKRCALLHDIGKYTGDFQRRLDGSPERVDHSTAGAFEAAALNDIIAAFCIAGHHAGLPDGGARGDTAGDPTLRGRLRKAQEKKIPDYSAFRQEVEIPPAEIPRELVPDRPSSMFFTRMLYSCLVDADYLDTEQFMKNGVVARGDFPPLEYYREKLRAWWESKLSAPSGELGRARNEILRAAVDAGADKPGLFTFTAPTGSGKTLSSMAFALEHARANRLRRVIYVIPYCSIIEQTQGVFEDTFGEGSIVAHYADVEYRTENNAERDKRYLAAENWDAPVILTTTVQFFESLFSNRPSRCRKLHNLAGSVLVFDEAQMLPVPLLRPCVGAIAELVEHYGCSAVLCTATQPALTRLFPQKMPARELCPRREEMFKRFRRVRYENAGTLDPAALAERLGALSQVLCVVNRRDEAQELYALLPEEGRFHLSTAMCPVDRRDKLRIIRQRLKDGLVCRVVSTSLVEAGVDLDFPTVYRALAGLDSIIQAGGRCNREGIPGVVGGTVYYYESGRKPPRMLEQNISAARYALGLGLDPADPRTVEAYFSELFYFEKGMEALDAKGILALCSSDRLPFQEIAEKFRVIDDLRCTVYIPLPGSETLFEALERSGPDRSLMRQLGPYAVGVYREHYSALPLQEVAENAAILTDLSLYSSETGLKLTIPEGRDLYS